MRHLNQMKKALQNPRVAIKYFQDNYSPLRSAIISFSSRYPIGSNVMNSDWDLLVILDTCRVDALKAVADDYNFINKICEIWSVGGHSGEWMAHTFDRQWMDLLSNTVYISANPHTKSVLEARMNANDKHIKRLSRYGEWNFVLPSELGYLEHVWKYELTDKEYKYSHTDGYTPPRYVTDRGIEISRNDDFDRMILHYLQPHRPYVSNAIMNKRDPYDYEKEPWEYIRKTGDQDTVFEAYLDELQFVLDNLEILLNNIDADKVIISADHGEAFGEYNIYEHHAGSLHPAIRRVPWVTTTATDSYSYTPQLNSITTSEHKAEKLLSDLGYVT